MKGMKSSKSGKSIKGVTTKGNKPVKKQVDVEKFCKSDTLIYKGMKRMDY
ncbi:MAG: hypothetical protein KJ899_15425 [Gammaproteobacteria bacterium]|nr:hypothetical protein [Gammaproteobacteria bacterium]